MTSIQKWHTFEEIVRIVNSFHKEDDKPIYITNKNRASRLSRNGNYNFFPTSHQRQLFFFDHLTTNGENATGLHFRCNFWCKDRKSHQSDTVWCSNYYFVDRLYTELGFADNTELRHIIESRSEWSSHRRDKSKDICRYPIYST